MTNDLERNTIPTDQFHSYPHTMAFEVSTGEGIHIENIPPLFPFDIETAIERYLAAMEALDADKLWEDDIGSWVTFADTAEQALESFLPIYSTPFRNCHCPAVIIENTAGFSHNADRETTSWVDAAFVWLQQWFSLFNSEYYARIKPELDGLKDAIKAARQNEDLPDAAIQQFVEHQLEDDDNTAQNATASTEYTLRRTK
jgi:hypothetical protein